VHRPGDPALHPPAPGEAASVYLLDNGFHADLVLPRASLAAAGGVSARAIERLPPGPWVAVGWGDAGFYRGTGLGPARLADGLRALVWPRNAAVIRMEALRASPDQLYAADAVTRIALSRRGLERAVVRLDRSFATADGAPIAEAGAAHDPDGRFFHSVERFHLLQLCNHWTAGLLNAAGLRTNGLLDVVPAGLRLDLRLAQP
jgi:uncharacterized protein (TIGR02117 family)